MSSHGISVFSDLASTLLSAALDEVDWNELADFWLNEEINENGNGGYEVVSRG